MSNIVWNIIQTIKTNESNSRYFWSNFFDFVLSPIFFFCFGPKKHMAQNRTPDFMCTTLTLDIINSTFHKIHLFMCEKPQYTVSSKYCVQFRLHRLLYAIEHGIECTATWNRSLATYILCQSCSRLLSFSLK